MERRVIIIDPNDKIGKDVLNIRLDDNTSHIDVAYAFACNKKLDNSVEGYISLAFNNYIVLFSVDNSIIIYTGINISMNQERLLKNIVKATFKNYENLNFELGILYDNNFEILQSGFTNIEDLLKYINDKLKGDDLDVRKKI